MLDIYTFGKTKAATDLTSILNDINDKKLNNNVSVILCSFNSKLNLLLKSNLNNKLKKEFSLLLLKDFKIKIQNSNILLRIQQYINNIITYYYRTFLKNVKR